MRRPHPAASRVLSAHGTQAWLDASPPVVAHLKGRDLKPVAGDWAIVDWTHHPPLISDLLPQRNRILRSEGPKTKVLAANIDLAILVIAGHPLFSPELSLRVLASLQAESIPVVIALNKTDLTESRQRAWDHLQALLPAYDTATNAGLPSQWPAVRVCEISCKNTDSTEGIDPLRQRMQRLMTESTAEETPPTFALIGQSGMGKSSLLNRLIPEASAQTQAISEALQTGRHTTTVSRGYAWAPIPSGRPAWVIDTPGFQRFGLSHLTVSQIAEIFPEWSGIHTHEACRFYNCQHQHEPGCAIKAEIAALEEKDPERGRHLALRREAWLGLIEAL